MMSGRGGLWLAALAVSTLAGCSHPTKLRIYNETGAPIVLHVSQRIRAGVERPERIAVAAGDRGEVFALEFQSLSAGGCVYNYSASLPVETNSMHVVVQVEPDFTVHLLSLQAGLDQVGAFRDGDAPGFPARPSKRCDGAAVP